MKNPSFRALQNPCQTWKGVGKAIDDPTSYNALLPTFHGMESENPILTSRSLKTLKLFHFTLKDKAKKFFPTHRSNGLKRQISNFSTKENEKFYECWERYMEAINASMFLKFQEDGMNQMPRYGRMKSQPNAKGGMYVLSEDMDMKAKFATMARRLEELELKKVQELRLVPYVNLISIWWRSVQPFQLCKKCLVIKQITYNSNWRNHPNFSWKPRPPQYTSPTQAPQQASNLEQVIVNLSKRMDGMQNDLSHKIDNIQYSISRLTNLNIVQKKGKFSSQPHQNPKGIHELPLLGVVRRLLNPHPS
ncbi:hypothetical protein AAG906_006020 [Vitis piasezkii]